MIPSMSEFIDEGEDCYLQAMDYMVRVATEESKDAKSLVRV